MLTCGDASLQFRVSRVRVRDKVRLVLGIGLVLGLATVLGLAHFTFCHSSSPRNPASPHARILPIARDMGCCIWILTQVNEYENFPRAYL